MSAWELHNGAAILKDPARVRNICILAHVDHGKTTIADGLLASNGIISQRMSGQMRFLDDRPDEQRRGITMKSSAVSVLYRRSPSELSLVNVVDTPGHVDFSSEVASAVRLSDGAVVVVDVVEGVSAQTHAVIKQAYAEQLQPVLLLNKIDRLILELQFSPAEAYQHLQRILEQVNAITSALFTAQVYEEDAAADFEDEAGTDADVEGGTADDNGFFAMMEDDNYDDGQYFDPARGNVVFASAIDGWGFTLNQFAAILSKKFKCRPAPLQNVLWGDYYMTKEKGKLRVKKGAASKGKTPLFVVGVLQTVWDIYDGVCISKDKEKMAKILKTLALKVSARDYQHPDPKVYLRALFGQWLPLSRSLLGMVCRVVPPPTSLTAKRASKLLYGNKLPTGFAPEIQAAHHFLCSEGEVGSGGAAAGPSAVAAAAAAEAPGVGVEPPLIAFVSKMVPVSRSQLPASMPTPVPTGPADQQAKRAALIAKRKAEGKDQAPPPRPAEDGEDVPAAADVTGLPATSRPVAARPVMGRPVAARPVMGRPKSKSAAAASDGAADGDGGDGPPALSGADAAAAAGLVLADEGPEKPPAISDSIMAWAQSVAPVPPPPSAEGGDNYAGGGTGAHGDGEAPTFDPEAAPAPEIVPMPASPPAAKPANEDSVAAAKRHAAMLAARRLASGDVDAATASAVPSYSSRLAASGADGAEHGVSHVMIAYTRIFSGTLRPGQQVHVLGPKYDPATPGEHREVVTIEKLYIIMGRDLIMVDEAPPGSVVGILGLEGHVLKTVTLSSTPNCPSVGRMNTNAKPIVRVVLDAVNIIDMPKLKQGMKLLYQADPCCEVLVQGSGEHVLVCAGEVHVERCVADLRERFCPGVKFTVSKPIIPLRETIVAAPSVDMTNDAINDTTNAVDNKLARGHYLLEKMVEPEDSGVVTIPTVNGHLQFKMRAAPLPAAVVDILVREEAVLQQLHENRSSLGNAGGDGVGSPVAAAAGAGAAADGAATASEALVDAGAAVFTALKEAFCDAGEGWAGAESKIVAFGPRQSGSNIIMKAAATRTIAPFFASFMPASPDAPSASPAWLHSVDVGFQLMTQSGPLAEEPMVGVAFIMEGVVEAGGAGSGAGGGGGSGAGGDGAAAAAAVQVDGSGYMPGEVIAAIKEACKWAFLAQPVRLLTAFYLCDMVVKASSLGKVYAVLNKRNSKILSEEMNEGGDFQLQALVPVTHSFGFAEEIRRKSSGLASPQLFFHAWKIVHSDPFWQPCTPSELDHFGDLGDAPNPASELLNDVRKRKGLFVKKQLVVSAEKQRTLGMNK